MVPVTVTDRQNHFALGLQASDFAVTDEGRPVTNFQFDAPDTVSAPVSIAIAIQNNESAGPVLLKLNKVGSMVQPLIAGEGGNAAVLSFADEARLVEDFTSDGDRIEAALRGIRRADGLQARSLDAALDAIHRLAARPSPRRRVLLLVAESRDRGSKAQLPDVIQAAQQAGVSVYALTFSAYATAFTVKGSDAPPPPSDSNWLRLITEPARLLKTKSADALTFATGGATAHFATLRALELNLSRVGQEIRSQYLISFRPSPEPGLHVVVLTVPGRPGLTVRYRRGYWNPEPAHAR